MPKNLGPNKPSSSENTPNDDITATADAHSTFDPETIGNDDALPSSDVLSAHDYVAGGVAGDDKMNDDDLAFQDSGNAQSQSQDQGFGAPSESFAPVGSSTVDAAPDETPTPAPEADAPATPPAPLPSPSELVDTAKEKAGDAKVAAGQAVDQAKQAAGQAVDQVKSQASEAFTQGKQAAADAFDKAKESVVSELSGQKDRASESLGGLTEALKQTGDQFRNNGIPFIPDYADQFAGQVDKVTAYLKDNDIEKLASDAEAFARRNPGLFIGGAFLLGIGIARFLKASGSNVSSNGGSSLNSGDVPAGFSGAPSNRERLDQISDDAIPSSKVYSAHGYVPGGVAGGG